MPRPRAPTITVDTSAARSPAPSVHLDEEDPLRHPPRESPADDHSSLQPIYNANSRPRSDSRPISPHNISSPTARSNDHTFLAVPDTRPRHDSLTSEESTSSRMSSVAETTSMLPDRSTLHNPSKRSAGLAPPEPYAIPSDEDALEPDAGNEADFVVVDNKFAFSPGQLAKLINPKSLPAFYAVGGLVGLERGLRTDRRAGLSVDEGALDGEVKLEDVKSQLHEADQPDSRRLALPARTNTTATIATGKHRPDSFQDRKRVFAENRLPEKKPKGLLQLAWLAYNDKILILLTIAAVVSLALGLYQTFGTKHAPGEAHVEWVEGVAIMVAIIIVVVVGAANDWQKERQFMQLNRKKEDRLVKVIRSGRTQQLSVYDVLVGDVVHVEAGDMVPVDGILIEGHGVKCDESSATGESDIIKKQAGDQVYQALVNRQDPSRLDPFILSGAKVTEGIGTFLVTAVGVHSAYGKTMISLREEMEATPLQAKLNVLAEQIAKLGAAAALLLFAVLFIKFLVQLPRSQATPSQKGQTFLQIFITAVTIIVVAVPEGLPLAVTLALAFATTRMMKDHNLVRVLRACETMGNATTVCSDKTGTLTENKMTVVAGSVGRSARFGAEASMSPERPERAAPALLRTPTSPTVAKSVTSKSAASQSITSPVEQSPTAVDDAVAGVPARELVATLAEDVRFLLKQSIVVNSSAFEGEEDGKPAFIGSKTETALLSFARENLGMESVGIERSNAHTVQLMPFDSSRKYMASVVKLASGVYRMYAKGAPEILLRRCSRIVGDPTTSTAPVELDRESRDAMDMLIGSYASRSLRTLALVYGDYGEWPPKGARPADDDPQQADLDAVFHHMVFLGLVGIQDPVRKGVPEAVRQCERAGVVVRMVTGDNVATACAIAKECGILREGDLVMEGPEFRKLNRTVMEKKIRRLRVLARSSPEDKRILVKRLKEMGETVAVTGDGTNDAPALKTADVGFSMGISGTEVAKEASSIILMDDNFASIVKAMMWGRAVNDSVKKFLQFQLTVNIAAVVLAFVSAVSSGQEASVLKAVQLLWVNLIMDTFAALALATDAPTESVLDRKPDRKSDSLISITMWKMIIGQSIFQLTVTFIMYFGQHTLLSYDSPREQEQIGPLIFNTFVWMQIFNMLNCRRLDNKFNVFEGVLRNYFFLALAAIIVGGQILIMAVGGRAFQVRSLNVAQWLYSIVFGFMSLLVGVIIRLIPDELFARLLPTSLQPGYRRKNSSTTPQLVLPLPDAEHEWNARMQDMREDLLFYRMRGGRLHALKFKLQHTRDRFRHPSASRSRGSSLSRDSSIPPSSSHGAGGGGGGGGSIAGPDGHPHPHDHHLLHQLHHGASHQAEATSPPPDAKPSAHSNRSRSRSRTGSIFTPAAAMAAVVAGGIAGFSPIDSRSHDDGWGGSRARGKSLGSGSMAAGGGGGGGGEARDGGRDGAAEHAIAAAAATPVVGTSVPASDSTEPVVVAVADPTAKDGGG
ncbi:MAG: hypothetical protein M1826_000917 [Phylliscum demangeonii]|nr:MAG: hypothetical protein M1826_000917 [Phylliscum demangeonii]